MNFKEYTDYFQSVIQSASPEPYNDPEFLNFTKLNWSRTNRWLKKAELNEDLKETIKRIDQPQKWIIITEPWCGDAAQIVPFLELAEKLNPLIEMSYELRDSEPFRINQYLTNGKSKSIPILVVKDENDHELFHWGPRPKDAQALHYRLRENNTDPEEAHIALQDWYNKDKGQQIQEELNDLLKKAK